MPVKKYPLPKKNCPVTLPVEVIFPLTETELLTRYLVYNESKYLVGLPRSYTESILGTVVLDNVTLPTPLPANTRSRLVTSVVILLLEITTCEFTGPAVQTLAKLLFTALNASRRDSPVPSLATWPTLIICCGSLMLNLDPMIYLPELRPC